MKTLILFILLIIIPNVNAMTIKKIDPYDEVKFGQIDVIYCSNTNITLRFDGSSQYRKTNVLLLSPYGNGIVKVETSSKNVIAEGYIKLIEGVETSLTIKIFSFDGEEKISIYDVYSKQLLLEISLRGVGSSDLIQRTTTYCDHESVRVYHNIQYKDWSVNFGFRERENIVEPNFSITKTW